MRDEKKKKKKSQMETVVLTRTHRTHRVNL